MACYSESSLNKEVQNDSEVEDTLSKNVEILPDFKEKPLSPVLSSGTVNRKFLMGNRSRRTKSRVKLTDRFIENDSQKKSSVESIANVCIPEFPEDSFTLSQTECLISRIEKLEEIEKYRQNIYKIMVTDGRNGDFCFKKPISPAPNKSKKSKITHTNENCMDTVESENKDETITKLSESRQIDLPKCSGFQTATGKTIEVSDTDIKRHSKLFEDIINPSQNCDTDRNKKYAFLSKSKSDIFVRQNNLNGIKPVLSESAMKLTKNGFNGAQTKFDSHISSEGFRETTSLKAGARKDNKHLFAEGENGQCNIKREVSLTQEICESGISNTQMLYAMNDALNAVDCNEVVPDKYDNSFKGFDLKESTKSQDFFIRLINIYQNFEQSNRKHNRESIFSINKELNEDLRHGEVEEKFKKHVTTDLPLPPKKRHCGRFGYTLNENNRVPAIQSKEADAQVVKERKFGQSSGESRISSESAVNKARNVFDDIHLNFCQNVKLSEKNHATGSKLHLEYKNIPLEGFSSASGKPIKISDNSLRKARSIFDNIEVDASKENLVDLPGISKKLTSNSNKKLFNETQKIEQTKLEDKIVKDANHSSSASETVMNVDNSPLPTIKHIFDRFNSTFGNTNKPPVNSNFPTMPGFQTAGGNKLKISKEGLRKAQNIFNGIELEDTEDKTVNDANHSSSASETVMNVDNSPLRTVKHIFDRLNSTFGETNKPPVNSKFPTMYGFQTAGGNKLKISKEGLRKAQNIFNDIELEEKGADILTSGFHTVGGSKLKASEEALGRAQKNLKDIELEEKGVGTVTSGFQTGGGSKLKISEEALSKAQKYLNDIELGEKGAGIVMAGGSELKVAEEALSKAQKYLNDIESEEKGAGIVMAGGSELKVSEEALSRAQKNLNDIPPEEKVAEVITPIKTSGLRRPTVASLTKHKRRLGISSCKQIQIPDSKLNKAKLLFEEDFCSKSPSKPVSKPVPSTTYASTPVRQNFCSTPVRNDFLRSSNNFSSFIDSAVITPIKLNVVEDEKIDFVPSPDSMVMFASPTKGNTFDWMNELEAERKKLEDRLKIVVERQKALERLREEKLDKRPRKGILYQSKCTKPRVFLSSLMFNRKSEDIHSDNDFCHINPQNAENVHFKKQFYSSVKTQDGAVIIPNSKDIIGVSEIENAFNAMPGVVPRLIPNGWLRNHYKWIIWKLASYERMFPTQLNGCFCVENVIQQLKYRYDREIDRAERSALRRIFEKDDAPQKRMILCVSEIKKAKYELELSDGWYGIRTVLDEPLGNQVLNGKIKIGTKLMICGAELLNCDGCYPLEATDLTCLRIHFNSTRRAVWHAKLGYQRNPGPFPVQISSIHPLGGLIGAVRICIVRVYPFNYFERLEGHSVWRNKKAEELRAQAWDDERCKKFEQILETVTRNFGYSQASQNYNFANGCSDISDISCPKTLYEIMKNSKDPDCLQEMLSPSQRRAILEYQNNLSIRKQEELASKMKEDVQNLCLTKRNVVAVLKLLVVDAGSPEKALNFFIWEPTESHMQILREGSCFTVQNVTSKKNGDLSSNRKTMFISEPSNQNLCDRFKRKLVQIVDFEQPNFSPYFSEFDTVGIVVQTKIDVSSQEAWLADNSGRLLLVNVYEGPNTCLMLDNLKRGQATTVCNLKYYGLKDDVVEALANHFTVVSSYSQHRHLQEGLEMFKKALPKDMDNLLRDCDNKIEVFRKKSSNILNSFCTNFEDSGEDTLVSSRITSTDVALSLIDLDKFM